MGKRFDCTHKPSPSPQPSPGPSPPGPPPPPPPPPGPSPPSPVRPCQTDTRDSTCDIVAQNSPEKKPSFQCPWSNSIGKYGVYVVPCNDWRQDLFYKVDGGWGGAHVTLSEFGNFSDDQANRSFENFKNAWYNNSLSKDKWRPGQGKTGFKALQHKTGWRGMGITSNTLDAMADTLRNTVYKPKAKGDWHITLASLTNQTFGQNDATYRSMVDALQGTPWSVVLVKIDKECGENGGKCKMVFHRKRGFFVGQHDVSTEAADVVV